MRTDEEIKTDLFKISDILVNCRQLTLDSYFMLVTGSNEKWTTIHRDKFLKRVRESLWKLAIIELTKLYGASNENDHYSIPILIKTLRRHHSSSSWQDKMTAMELKTIEGSFKIEDMKVRIKKLIELRNQHFAHTDKNPQNNVYNVKFYFDDCIFLIEKAEEIITNLSDKFGYKIDFQKYNGEHMTEFIERHIEYRKFYPGGKSTEPSNTNI